MVVTPGAADAEVVVMKEGGGGGGVEGVAGGRGFAAVKTIVKGRRVHSCREKGQEKQVVDLIEY